MTNQVKLWVYNDNAHLAEQVFDNHNITVVSKFKGGSPEGGFSSIAKSFVVTWFVLDTDLSQTKISDLFAEAGFGRKFNRNNN